MAGKIPATVVTGFLGAGKTTLIRHMLTHAGGRRIALVINEFGDLGVDGDILRGCGEEVCREDEIVELSNGCICCTVADDFIPTMEALLARDSAPDHIVIETSGLALPQPLIRAFNWPAIRNRVTVDGVVTVVDGKAVSEGRFAHDTAAVDRQRAADDNLDHETPLAELFEDQIACADMIVVNKSDLMEDGGTALAGSLKGDARSGVQVLTSSMGVLPTDVVLGQNVGAESDLEARHERHHHHDDDHDDDLLHTHQDDATQSTSGHHHDHGHDAFESFVVTRAEIDDPQRFAQKVADVIRAYDILRLKGFASVRGKPMRLTIQAVGPRVETYFDQPVGAERQTRLVVIGQSGLDRAGITAALKE